MPSETHGNGPQEPPSPYAGLEGGVPYQDRRLRPRTHESLAQTAYLNGIRRIYTENAGNPVFLDSFARFHQEERQESGILTSSLLTLPTPVGDIPYSHKLEINAIKLAAAEARVRAAEQESMTDPLTGALNRRGLQRELEKAHEGVRSGGQAATLVQLDLDHFKSVNDTIGHDGGDIALIATVMYLREQLGEEVTIARAGGEEFYVLLPQDTTNTRARLEGIRPGLRDYLRSQLLLGEKPQAQVEQLALTASWGVAAITPESNLEGVKRSTDIALYAAKESGRDRILSITDPAVTEIDTSGIALRDIQAAQEALEAERIHPPTPPRLMLGTNGNGEQPQQ